MGDQRILILETSGLAGEVAVATSAGILARQALAAARKHARDLMPAVQELLRGAGWKPADLQSIFVDLGPGSYTGLRVGVVTAKTLAYSLGIEVVAVEAADVLAAQAPADALQVQTMIDAQQGLIYVTGFERSAAGRLRRTGLTAIQPAAAWAATLPAGTFVTGPALDRYRTLVPAAAMAAPPSQCHPTAEGLWQVGLAALCAGLRADFWTLEPLYLRPSSAEQKWARRAPE